METDIIITLNEIKPEKLVVSTTKRQMAETIAFLSAEHCYSVLVFVSLRYPLGLVALSADVAAQRKIVLFQQEIQCFKVLMYFFLTLCT